MSATEVALSPGIEREFTAWGGAARSRARLLQPRDEPALAAALRHESPLLVRGAGCSYGDAALLAGGSLLDLAAWAEIADLDPVAREVTCGAGLRLGALISALAPEGWFPTVVPGTRHVTVGGAVAADVHGKNHHREGSFGRHVAWLDLMRPRDGVVLRCSLHENRDLFTATLGGMGLTGPILRARLRLRPLPSLWVHQRRLLARDLDHLLSLCSDYDRNGAYAIAWLDGMRRRRGFGRGVLLLGDHAVTNRPPPPPRPDRPARPWMSRLLRPSGLRAFNRACFARHRLAPEFRTVPFDRFLFPLDRISGWNRLYGPAGFAQFQCVVPRPEGIEALLRAAVSSGGSYLAVLKRFGREPAPGLLSFPMPGWTLSLDFPLANPRTPAVLSDLNEIARQHEGRVYFAKDSSLEPAAVDEMYPRLNQWRAIKSAVDPHRRIASDLDRRLGISETP